MRSEESCVCWRGKRARRPKELDEKDRVATENWAFTDCSWIHAQQAACATLALLLVFKDTSMMFDLSSQHRQGHQLPLARDGWRIRKKFNVTSHPSIPAKAVQHCWLSVNWKSRGKAHHAQECLRLRCAGAWREGAVEGAKDDEADEDPEAEPAKGAKRNLLPSAAEVAQHNLTHLPYRSWCKQKLIVACGELLQRAQCCQRRGHLPEADPDRDRSSTKSSAARP
eukprot:2668492-Amphidinium_carterae.1